MARMETPYDAAFRQQLKARRADSPMLGSAADAAAPMPTLGQTIDTATARDLSQRVAHMADSGAGFSVRDLERYLGRNDLLRINYLERGLLAARAVCRLRVSAPFGGGGDWGTGFLVSPRLLLTNHHVIPDAAAALNTIAEFGYEADANGRLRQSQRFRCLPQQAFLSDAKLDITLVALEPTSEDGSTELADYGFLRLIPTTSKIDEREFVTLIQHPNGDEKYIAIRENHLIKKGDATSEELDNFLWYASDTAPGSSGAPAFNDHWQVVAVHHSSVPEAREQNGVIEYQLANGDWVEQTLAQRLPDDQVRWIANEGVRVSKIVACLSDKQAKEAAPSPLVQALLDDASGVRPFPGTIPRESVVAPTLVLPPAAHAEPTPMRSDRPLAVLPSATPVAVVAEPTVDAPERRRRRPRSSERTISFYDGRVGYDANFLGVALPLPQLTATALRHGDPAPVTGSTDPVLRYTHFSVVMNAARRIAFYTAVNIDGARWMHLERGEDKWFYDPRLAEEHQLGNTFYSDEPGRKGWFDRGHLVRRLDPVWGTMQTATLANDDSFHWTNCAPQYWGFNQGEELWQGLENFILFNTDAEDIKASVFSGPLFRDDDEEHRGILVPQFFWKVVVVRDQVGALSSSAYVVSQQRYARNLPFERLPVGQFNNFQVAIAKLERETGLTFPDAIRAADVRGDAPDDLPLRGLSDIDHPRR
jgi:endonuclease G, mitochondrial